MFKKIKKYWKGCIIKILFSRWEKIWNNGWILSSRANDYTYNKVIIEPLKKENEQLRDFIKKEKQINKDKGFSLRAEKFLNKINNTDFRNYKNNNKDFDMINIK